MPAKMSDTIRPEYRIVRGSLPRALRKPAARAIIERETHGIVLAATDDGVPKMFADWWFDLRRKRLRVYGALLRFIDLCALRDENGRRRAPKWIVKMIPQWIDAYIDDAYADGDDPNAAEAA